MPECRFLVESFHPTVSSEKLVATLIKSMPALTRRIRKKWPEAAELTVTADREKSVPIDPVTAYLIVKFVGATAGGALLQAMIKDSYEYLKGRVKDGILKPVDKSPPTAGKLRKAKSAPAKKKAKKKSRAKK